MKFLDKHFGRSGNRMFQLFYIYAQFRDGILPDYYLQDCKYFDKYRNELQQMFGQGEKDNRVSIHIRRGKNPSLPKEPAYSENPFYVDLTKTEYYKNALTEITIPGQRYLIFSDDMVWTKNYFGSSFMSDWFDYFEGSEEEDFRAMANCKGHIIANSSFSYMAAYLGGGKTIYPKAWFMDGVQRVGFPNDWIAL